MARTSVATTRQGHSERQILAILRAGVASGCVATVLRRYRVSDTTYYRWKQKYGPRIATASDGVKRQAETDRRLRTLEHEVAHLKQLVAMLTMSRSSSDARPRRSRNRELVAAAAQAESLHA